MLSLNQIPPVSFSLYTHQHLKPLNWFSCPIFDLFKFILENSVTKFFLNRNTLSYLKKKKKKLQWLFFAPIKKNKLLLKCSF